MGVAERVVMSNAAAARRLYTRGNNEAPLPTDFSGSDPYCTADSHCFSEEEDDTPQAPSPRVDRSRPNRSNIYRSSTQNADAAILRTCKVDDISLSILTVATPRDLSLSRLHTPQNAPRISIMRR
jgi:hypothetical protein